MWIARWIFGLIIIVAILGFALQNQDQTVSVLIVKWQSPPLPLYIYLYFAFGAGLLCWALVSIFKVLHLKSVNIRLQRENKKLHNQLDRLRNADIDEPLPESGEKTLELPTNKE